MVKMQSVSSSSVAAVGYEEQFEELFIEYIRSGTYVYSGVPMTIYEDLLRAPSVGVYVNQVIKPAYPCSRL